MARVLVIDDDPALLDVLALALEDAGHTPLTAGDGIAGLARVAEAEIVLCDVNMPRLDGFSFCRRVREAGGRVPIVLLTSRDGEVDEALGLDLGADDYVTKPFSTRVLLARVAALLRREAVRAGPASTVRTIGALEIDGGRMEVRWRGAGLVVTVTELRMIEVLSERRGVVFTRDRLLEKVRGDDSVVEPRLVDTYVRRLRRKFEAVDPAFDQIQTLVGAGYRWRD